MDSDSWPTDIDQYATVDGPSADNSLWQFYEHLRPVHVAGAMPPLDGTDGAATGGHHDGAGSAPDGTDLNAHSASVPVGSSTPPSIIMNISSLATTGGGGPLPAVRASKPFRRPSSLWTARRRRTFCLQLQSALSGICRHRAHACSRPPNPHRSPDQPSLSLTGSGARRRLRPIRR